MKRIIQLTLLLVAILVPATSSAYDFMVNGIYYEKTYPGSTTTVRVTYKYVSYLYDDDGDVYATTYISDYSGSVTIPSTITYNGVTYSVTEIGYRAFSGCTGLTNVTIPSSVTSIRSSAFQNCSGLTNITIPNSVTSIDDYAFQNCSGLTSITIPNSVTSIGDYAFQNCSNLVSAILSGNITTIGESAFMGCSKLAAIDIDNNSLSSIGVDAFYGCSQLEAVNISSLKKWLNCTFYGSFSSPFCYGADLYVSDAQITNLSIPIATVSIPSYAFYGCSGLTNVTIPNSVTLIGNYAFSRCTGLTSVIIPNSVTSIGGYAFSNCTGLTSIYIPSSVTSVGNYAFSNCTGLTSITINNAMPSTVFSGCTGVTSVTISSTATTLDGSMFSNLKNLSNITVESGNTTYDSRNECNAIIETASNTLIRGCQNTTIPNSVTSIGNHAFQNCTGLTSVTIPNSVTSIGSAFSGCTGLTSITIPNSVTSIGGSAFWGCTGLTSITIPNSVTSIGNRAFYECSGLTSVTIGNSVTSIDERTFSNCSGLASVTIGNSVTSIGLYAFEYCSGLKNLTWNAINCSSRGSMPTSNIQNVTIGNEVQILPNSFVSGSKITSVTIPNSVTSIGNSAFSGCGRLTSITIPNSVTSIGDYAFQNCNALETLNFNAVSCADFKSNSYYNPFNNLNISTINIGNNVQKIPAYFAYNLTKLSNITISYSVTSIGSNAFANCDIKALKFNAVNCGDIASNVFKAGLTLSSLQFGDSVRHIPAGLPTFDMTGSNLLIPNSVQTIAAGALSSGVCDAVVIGNGLNALEAGTFSEGIKVAYVSTAEPIPSAPAAFGDPQTLYVPGGSKVKYWTAQGWNEFKEIIQGPYIPVDALAMDSVISMPKGATRQLSATISPTDATAKSIKWFSKDSTIATVDNKGIIQAINHGETDIYAVVDTVMAICHVNVNVALVEELTLNVTQLLLEPDAIYTLTATANPDYAENQAVEWEIPENDVIVHITNGNSINIGTLQEGTVTVTAHTVDGSNLSASCTINVNQNIVHVTSVELDRASAGMTEGETLQLMATVMPEDATNRSVTWTSSNEDVATVDQNGLVTAVAAGTATITATTIDGSELSASCEVTVNGVATVNNTLDADALSARCGEEKQLAVRMDNESSITALQCDIYLPEGVSIATEDGDYLIDLVPARKATNHTVSTNDLPNGAIRLFITSATSKPFKGNSGDLFILNLVVDGDAESGEYSLDLRNIILSDTEAHPYYVPDLNVPVTIMDYIKGDVNIDGTVNVSDYVATANYILELDPHPFLFVAADIDENLTINVSDLVGVANIALNFMGAPAIYHAPAMGYGGEGLMSFTANCSTISPNRHVVTLDLSNSNAVTAFQMDINLPDGLKLVDASLSDRATASHSLEMTTLASGAYRLLGASMMSKAFAGSEGALLTLEIEGDAIGAAVIDGIMLAEPDATLHQHDAMTLALGNSGVHEMMSDVNIYLQDGMVVVESPVASKVQFILPNGMSVVREVKAGRNVYNTGLKGVVIVKVGNQVNKFRL